ncbi:MULTISPECIES: TonB-dependent receptor [unclassified Pseudoxanthomonas]|uniref:TonB-dependent receptor n=1 Tax=unclassified Pseudoxanthomonas TaxID=2645906 RepID=UPI0030784DE8
MKKQKRTNKPTRKLLTCALASCLMLSMPTFAQSTGATLRGQVAGSPVSTEVVATNVATGAVRRTQTTANGTYTLVGLPPGTYTVQAGGISKTVTLAVAANSTLNLAPDTAAAAPAEATDLEAVRVSAPLLRDVRTSEVGNTISQRQIEQLPQATRNFLEFADTVPGMQFKINAQGVAELRSGATNTSSTNLFIDGVSQKSYVERGGIAGQQSSGGNPFPQLAIGEYKVITSNYKAEYGQISGAAITAATRSGTNEFQGEAFYHYTDESMREKLPSEEEDGKGKSQIKEWGVALGGPILKDRMHFFIAYENKENIYARSIQPSAESGNAWEFLPEDLRSQYGAAYIPLEEDLFFGKLSWDIGERDRLELSGQHRDETQAGNIGGLDTPEHGQQRINKDKRANLRWQHSGDRFFNELIVATEESENNPNPFFFGSGRKISVFDFAIPGEPPREYALLNLGPADGFSVKSAVQKGWSIQNDLTFNSFQWHGDHTIKMGVSYKDIDLSSSDGQPYNPQFSYQFDPTTGVVSGVPYRVEFLAPFDEPGQSALVKTSAKQYGFYIQDDWEVNERLILNLGIRWDYEDVPAYTDHVTSADYLAALYGPDPANPGEPWVNRWTKGGIDAINPNDYISNGSNRENFKDAWAPRLGFSYDMNADEQHVIHGGVGRSYDRNLFKDLALEKTKSAVSLVRLEFQDPATGECVREGAASPLCIPWDPNYLNGIDQLGAALAGRGGAEVFMLNNKLKTPYSDQISLGMTNQIGEWLTDVTVQRIMSRDGFGFTLANRHPDGSFFVNGGQPWGETVPGYGGTIVGDNGVESNNTQLLLSLEKPYTKESGWGVNFGYTHTHARHNSTNSEDPFAYFDKSRLQYVPFVKSSTQPKHRFTAAGSIDGPWGITFGAKIVLETPTPRNTIACYGVEEWDGSRCQLVGFMPPANGKFLVGGKIFSYRTVDFQATKEFSMGGDTKLTIRANLLNAFNFKNYSEYRYNGFGSNGQFDPDVEVNEDGDIFYFPRTVNVEVGFKF